MSTCKQCNGRKIIVWHEKAYDIPFSPMIRKTKPCPRCGGTGTEPTK